jgi:RNA polymerase sigma-70 factor, ECF subfamily
VFTFESKTLRDLDDANLAKQAVEGDGRAFSEIVRRYQGPIYNTCFRYLGVRDAEDAAQETFIRAFTHRESFDTSRAMMPWLITIARRLCLDRIRQRKRETFTEDEKTVIADVSPGADESIASRQELDIVNEGLKQLPEGQREAVALYHIDGLPYKEVAEILDVPIGTVMTWLHRGRTKLRELVEAKG